MNPFTYARPLDVSSALGLLGSAWGTTEILAGGTDVLALLKDYVLCPSRLVDINNIETLRTVELSDDGLDLGSLVTLDELANHKDVRRLYPALAEAIGDAASPQIRNVATLGGNLCQRPRCWYFRNGYGLLALDATGDSLALKGDNRFHAILGNGGPAYFVSPSTIAPVLVALGAIVTIAGPARARSIPLEEFYITPQKEGDREHNLEPNELVTRLRIPPLQGSIAYYEVRQKHGFDWPLATATAVLTLSGSTIAKASIVLGHVAPTPWRASEAESLLVGQVVNESLAAKAGQSALQQARSLGQNGYKIHIARTCLKRAILQAAGIAVPPPHPGIRVKQ
jgi:xanthine dehydrogenase YagS FAD-binding subunit